MTEIINVHKVNRAGIERWGFFERRRNENFFESLPEDKLTAWEGK